MKVLIVLCSILVYSQALIGHVCQDNTQCGAGECCQILKPLLIASKRQLISPNRNRPTSGTCQLYKRLGDACDSYEKSNGYCSCEPGSECTLFEAKKEEVHSVVRRMMRAPRPGYSWVQNCSAVAMAMNESTDPVLA